MKEESTQMLNVLLSAYACEPGKGSEAGVGWNVAVHMAKFHNVWILTRANNRELIERNLPENSNAQFIYYDLPLWARWWKRGARGAQLYYYLWHLFSGRMLKKAYSGKFDVGHHVTFVRYWVPTCFAGLGIPYVIGPVGGGEFAPIVFERKFPFKVRCYEWARRFIRFVAAWDPLLRTSIRRASHILSTTEESAQQIRKLGGQVISVYPESGVSLKEYEQLTSCAGGVSDEPFVFICSGRLLALKGFDLAIKAFMRASLDGAKLWILGDGPDRNRLERLAGEAIDAGRIQFLGWQPRTQALETLASAHVLVHPSLHDSGGWVCPEAMALGKPVICLKLGGPGSQVTDEIGIPVEPTGYDETIDALASAMRQLAHDPERCKRMGEAGQQEVAQKYIWENKCAHYASIYEEIKKERGVPCRK